jgi:hypothetical protein
VVSSQSKAALFIWMSGLHKAIRRGSLIEANHYGGLLHTRYGPQVVQKYLIKIFFEESREIGQFLRLGKSWWEDVAILCQARKKFERTDLFPQVPQKALAYIEALKRPEPPESMDQLLNHQTYYSALSDIWRIRMAKLTKSKKRRLAKEFHQLLPSNSASAQAFMKVDFYAPGYMWLAALEEFYRPRAPVPLPAESTAIEPAVGDVFLQPGDFVFDQHTFRGLALIKRHWRHLGPGIPMANGLDLRFSGSVMGCFWRECAFRQYGPGFVDARWEDVVMEPRHWHLSIKLDSHFYTDFHAKYSQHIFASHLVPDEEVDGHRES